jgi:hypothetical protein
MMLQHPRTEGDVFAGPFAAFFATFFAFFATFFLAEDFFAELFAFFAFAIAAPNFIRALNVFAQSERLPAESARCAGGYPYQKGLLLLLGNLKRVVPGAQAPR